MWNRVNKNKCRKLAAEFPHRTAKSVLMMPSGESLCVKEAVRSGLIKGTTKAVFVERNRTTFGSMTTTLDQLGVQGDRLRHGLHRVNLDRTYDYAFLDFNGPITTDSAQWIMSYLAPRLSLPCDLAITVHAAYRNCIFAKECHGFFDKYPEYVYEITRKFGLENVVQATYFLTLVHLFGNLRFDFYFIRHRDTHTMLTFLMKSVCSIDCQYEVPAYEDFRNFLFGDLVMPKQTKQTQAKKRSAAAVKAWETRRAKKRSDAARKAWVTRRAATV